MIKLFNPVNHLTIQKNEKIMKQFDMRRFRWTLISILIITPIGFLSKFYQGPAASWVNDSLGGLFYEIFWCLVLFLLFPKSTPLKIAVIVFVITCLLEFLQLYHPPFLEVIRNNFIGVTIIGDSFTWSDFPYYFIGSGIGWLWLKWIKNKTTPNQGRFQRPFTSKPCHSR